MSNGDGVFVFWDFETSLATSSPAGTLSTYEMITNIRAAIAMYGPVKFIKLYWDYGASPPSTTLHIRSELSASGVTLIDCPSEGRGGAAIKKMLVDMILFACDHPSPTNITVITGDRDLAYALAVLRMKSDRVILISPVGSHLDLTSQASVQLDWSRTILGMNNGSDGDDLLQMDPLHLVHSPSLPQASLSTPKAGIFPPKQDSTILKSNPTPAQQKPVVSSSPSHGLGAPPFIAPMPLFGQRLPSFLHPQSTDHNWLRSRSGSLPEASTLPGFGGKERADIPSEGSVSGPRIVFNRQNKGKMSEVTMLNPFANIFSPFVDELAFSRSSPSGHAVSGTASIQSTSSRKSRSSFEQIPKPEEPKPIVQQPRKNFVGQSINEKAGKNGIKPPKLPYLKPSSNRQAPHQVAKSGPSKQIPSRIPEKWEPLILTLRKHNGVLSKSDIAMKVLQNYPQAFNTAGTRNKKDYLAAALSEGIISEIIVNDSYSRFRLHKRYSR